MMNGIERKIFTTSEIALYTARLGTIRRGGQEQCQTKRDAQNKGRRPERAVIYSVSGLPLTIAPHFRWETVLQPY